MSNLWKMNYKGPEDLSEEDKSRIFQLNEPIIKANPEIEVFLGYAEHLSIRDTINRERGHEEEIRIGIIFSDRSHGWDDDILQFSVSYEENVINKDHSTTNLKHGARRYLYRIGKGELILDEIVIPGCEDKLKWEEVKNYINIGIEKLRAMLRTPSDFWFLIKHIVQVEQYLTEENISNVQFILKLWDVVYNAPLIVEET